MNNPIQTIFSESECIIHCGVVVQNWLETIIIILINLGYYNKISVWIDPLPKLEMLKVSKNLNHFALKAKIYVNALQSAYAELQKLQPMKLSA